MTDKGRRLVRIVAGGPVLVEGPVCVQLPDGSTVHSDRFMVAICVCRRSKCYPLCDTSHRSRVRATEVGSHRDNRAESSRYCAGETGVTTGEPAGSGGGESYQSGGGGPLKGKYPGGNGGPAGSGAALDC